MDKDELVSQVNDSIDKASQAASQWANQLGAQTIKNDTLTTWGWASYILHLIVAAAAVVPGAQASVGLLLIALVIDFVKKAESAGTVHESHINFRIRTVVWALIWYVITAPLWLLLLVPGLLAWGVVSIWFLYRIVSGMMAMNKGQAL